MLCGFSQSFRSSKKTEYELEEDMEVKKSTTIETTERYEFSTDDIEELIKAKYNFAGDVRFDWNIGQWVSLNVVVKSTTDA